MKKKHESIILVVILVSIIIFLSVLIVIGVNKENKTLDESINNEENYHTVSYILDKNSTEKIEKIVVDSDISSSDMQNIYKEKEIENSAYNTYTIWFYSSDENAQTANEYELGSVTKKDNIIEIINVKEEKAEKEYEEYKKELAQEEEERQEKEAKEKEQEEKKYKDSCKKLAFEELARNPEKVKGTKVKLTGEVIQVSENYISIGMRVNITENEYGWYEDTVYIIYYPENGEDKILEDDIITIYGTAEGEYSYTSVMGAYITIPKILAEYIEIN